MFREFHDSMGVRMNRGSIADMVAGFVGADSVIRDEENLLCYTYNAGAEPPTQFVPSVVAFPKTAREVSGILKFANQNGIAVVTRGEASNLSESALPPAPDCIVISTKRMKDLQVDPGTLTATVGAGVTTADIKAAAERVGLFYPPDPASFKFSSIGGNVACDAGGLQCVKYGTTKNYVLGIEAVLPSGEIIHTGGKCVKNVAGYDLTHLLIGSEGTLAVMTGFTLKLIALPEGKRTMMAIFGDVDNAALAVSKIMTTGVVPSIMEFMENTFIRGIEDFCHLGLPVDAAALLLMEVDGDLANLDKQSAKIKEVCDSLSVQEFKIARDAKEADEFWTARRAALPALARVAKGRLGGDPAVPIDRLPDIVRLLHELETKYQIKTACQGHAGDGNVHPHFFFDNPEQKERAAQARSEFHEAIIGMGGTVTAEHGVGRSKIKYLRSQLGDAQVDLMRAIKSVFDPNNILNPGTIFGEQ